MIDREALKARCATALACLPDAQYREMLERLLNDLMATPDREAMRALAAQDRSPPAEQPWIDEAERLVREYGAHRECVGMHEAAFERLPARAASKDGTDTLDGLIAHLRNRPDRSPPVAPAWQPIETAPKDRLLLLAWADWAPSIMRGEPCPVKVGGYWENAWHVYGASWWPTHWQELPAPPAGNTPPPPPPPQYKHAGWFHEVPSLMNYRVWARADAGDAGAVELSEWVGQEVKADDSAMLDWLEAQYVSFGNAPIMRTNYAPASHSSNSRSTFRATVRAAMAEGKEG